jgi:hypothetical protein
LHQVIGTRRRTKIIFIRIIELKDQSNFPNMSIYVEYKFPFDFGFVQLTIEQARALELFSYWSTLQILFPNTELKPSHPSSVTFKQIKKDKEHPPSSQTNVLLSECIISNNASMDGGSYGG